MVHIYSYISPSSLNARSDRKEDVVSLGQCFILYRKKSGTRHSDVFSFARENYKELKSALFIYDIKAF
jgi:hypothetical protein